jgi:hypothetical protein
MEGKIGTVGAKRSPESFPQESSHRKHMLAGFQPLKAVIKKKSGYNSDRKSKLHRNDDETYI